MSTFRFQDSKARALGEETLFRRFSCLYSSQLLLIHLSFFRELVNLMFSKRWDEKSVSEYQQMLKTIQQNLAVGDIAVSYSG